MRGMRGRSGFGISQFIMGLCLIVLGAFTCLRPRSIFTGDRKSTRLNSSHS